MRKIIWSKYKIILIGVSAGGMEALKTILFILPVDFPLPILVVQHLNASSDDFLAQFLNAECRMHVKEADEKEKIIAGSIYIAPANYHMLIEDDKTISLSMSEPVNYARPSIDVLFETAADVYFDSTIGIILTGASSDGSNGLKKVKDYHGLTIVQDPETAVAKIMPFSAIEKVNVDFILPLNKIGKFLISGLYKKD